MKAVPAEFLDYYDAEITALISQKYGYSPMDALRRFVGSQSHAMLREPALEMWEYAPLAVFDMWEVEQVTGNPRNSVYFRMDDE